MNKLAMIKKFQCPGCLVGMDTDCGKFKSEEAEGFIRCTVHVAGTSMMAATGFITMCLGLPRGFNRCGLVVQPDGIAKSNNVLMIRLYTEGNIPDWDHLNVPVWAMEKDGFLFVRTYMPRNNMSAVDVIENGKIAELCPNAIDVGKFYDDID